MQFEYLMLESKAILVFNGPIYIKQLKNRYLPYFHFCFINNSITRFNRDVPFQLYKTYNYIATLLLTVERERSKSA